MATLDFWQRVSASMLASPRWQETSVERSNLDSSNRGSYWVALDVVTILVSAALATFYKFRTSPLTDVKGFWHGTLIPGRSMGILLGLLCGYAIALIVTSRRMHLLYAGAAEQLTA
jgi:hypothetical protein